MSGWEKYFEKNSNGNYVYKDKNVVKLPDNLPMPPTSSMYGMFEHCTQLQDISALANWDISNVTDMSYMFHGPSAMSVCDVVTFIHNKNASLQKENAELKSRLSALEEKFETFMKMFQAPEKLYSPAPQESNQEYEFVFD